MKVPLTKFALMTEKFVTHLRLLMGHFLFIGLTIFQIKFLQLCNNNFDWGCKVGQY